MNNKPKIRPKRLGNNLYIKFIYDADKRLNKNGYLLFINPPSFFSPSLNKNNRNLRKDIFDKYYHHYINLEECSKHFKIGSKFIYYLIQKNDNTNNNLQIICKYNEKIYDTKLDQKLLLRDYLPCLLTLECLQVLDKVKNKNLEKLKIFDSPDNRVDKAHIIKKNKNETYEDFKKRAFKDGYIYPIQSTGSQIAYSKKQCTYQNDKKVLMSRSGYLNPFYDNGKLGVGGNCFAHIVRNEDEGQKVIALMNSQLYTFYNNTNKWSGFNSIEVLQDLSNIIDVINNVNDTDINKIIYEYFNITDSEIKLIKQSLNLL